jgi:outer membrane protein/protease secretion system outer membrane protein
MVAAVLLGVLAAPAAIGMDFRQAYEAALENDASIRASRAAAQASSERLPQARAQLLPNVSLNLGRNFNDLTSEGRNMLGQPTTSETRYWSGNQTLSVRQPIYRPYLGAQLRQAEAQVRDADASLEKDEQSLVVRVGESYFEALLARDQVALVLAQKATFTSQLDAAKKGFAAGSGTRTDVDDAQARLDMTLAQELEARQNEGFSRHKLEALTGQPVRDLAGIDAARFSPQEPIPLSVQDWITRAEEHSPELESLRAQLEAAQQEIEKAKAGHRPTLDAVAQWAKTNSDSVTSVNSRYNNKSIGLQLSVPLYSGGYVSSTVRQAVATQTRVQEMLEATRRDLGVRVYREFRAVTEGALRIKALEQAVRSAEQALTSSRKSYAAGSRTSLDVLNAEQQRVAAMRDLAQARYVYLVSRLRLHSLVGDERMESVMAVNAWLAP